MNLLNVSTFLFLTLLLYICQCRMIQPMKTYSSSDTNLYDALQCLKTSGFTDQVFIEYRLPDYPSNPNLTLIQQKINVTPHIIFFCYLGNQMTLPAYAAKYAQQLNTLPVKMVWLYVTSSAFGHSCKDMFEFALALQKNLNKPMGIHDDGTLWKSSFGDQTACPQFGMFPLYWWGKEPFQPFGGFSSYQLKSFTPAQYACHWESFEVFNFKQPSDNYEVHLSNQRRPPTPSTN